MVDYSGRVVTTTQPLMMHIKSLVFDPLSPLTTDQADVTDDENLYNVLTYHVQILSIESSLNGHIFCCACFIAVKYWNVTDDGTSFLSIILRKVSMVAFLLLRICSSVLCLFHGLCMMSIPHA